MKITKNSLLFVADGLSIFPSFYRDKGHFARLTRWGRKKVGDFVLCRCVINSQENVFSLSAGKELKKICKEKKKNMMRKIFFFDNETTEKNFSKKNFFIHIAQEARRKVFVA